MQGASETSEQQAVIEWASYAQGKYPGLKNLYHVPNEGKRTKATAGILKSLGLKPGVPDLILDYPAGVYHGLRIEMKYGKNLPSEDQKDWLRQLQAAGYFVAVVWSANAAIHLLTEYMNLKSCEKMAEDADLLKVRWGFPSLDGRRK